MELSVRNDLHGTVCTESVAWTFFMELSVPNRSVESGGIERPASFAEHQHTSDAQDMMRRWLMVP